MPKGTPGRVLPPCYSDNQSGQDRAILARYSSLTVEKLNDFREISEMLAGSVHQESLQALRDAARTTERVSGLTHRHYKYPARFSPLFVGTAIEAFSKPGDIVLDPYMGGGTTVVEAMVRGRRAVGCDLNSLAVFVARAKTTHLNEAETFAISAWVQECIPDLHYHFCTSDLEAFSSDKRTKNLTIARGRPLKKIISIALSKLGHLESANAQQFVRCALLNTAQWALNGRKRQTTIEEFRTRFQGVIAEMLLGSADLSMTLRGTTNPVFTPTLLHTSAENLSSQTPFTDNEQVDLVVTSPPYPGVHILYHRWQIDGRRESPAPYWIANCMDGQGSAFYNFGDRKQENHNNYFAASLRTLRSIRSVMRKDALMVQMIAFSDPKRQLPRYLANMEEAGFRELKSPKNRAIRTWRDVPSRSWHATLQGRTKSSREVVLIHSAT